MEENPTPAAPLGETEATPTNLNQPVEAQQTPAQPQVDLHGFTEEQLADMSKFFNANGGFDAVKSKISNPAPAPAPAPEQQTQQPQQYDAQPQYEPQTPPKGYASLQELSVERYFKDLASDPKYANIADQIQNGDVLKEMASMGMTPIDSNYNINIDQLNQFLALKSASVPTQPTSVEPTNVPTVDYVPVEGDNITSVNQALDIVRQSVELKGKGLAEHPALAKAQKYLMDNKFGQ